MTDDLKPRCKRLWLRFKSKIEKDPWYHDMIKREDFPRVRQSLERVIRGSVLNQQPVLMEYIVELMKADYLG